MSISYIKILAIVKLDFQHFLSPPPLLKHAILSHLGAKNEKNWGHIAFSNF